MFRVRVDDRSSYELRTLKLIVASEEEEEQAAACSCSSSSNKKLKVIGKGGYGSIYVGTVLQRREPDQYTQFPAVRSLGIFHGVLLQGHAQCSVAPAPVEESFTQVLVAVKRVELSCQLSREDLEREARNLRLLWGCRNFASLYGPAFCEELQCVCIVMELVPGCNLNQFLRSRGAAAFKDADEKCGSICLPWSSNEVLWWTEKLSLFREIVLALMLCHRKQVYHGDLKGENVLLDKRLIPKMIDFGMSFRSRDLPYLRSVGGSLLWVAPEVIVQPGTLPSEVLADPFPSDVYSLGMLLAEILIDGEIPESFTDELYIIVDKCAGVCPIPLDGVQTDDPFLVERVLDRLKSLVDECCRAEREERISLQTCLTKVEEVYSDLCSFCTLDRVATSYERNDHMFTETKAYRNMMRTFQERFPSVPDCIVLRPSRNMVMDEEGSLLVHYFCKLDFAEGVQYIVEKSTWDFQPERDIPYISLLCVEEESLSTLKYLAASWTEVMRRQLLLIHKACNCANLEVFRLLLDVGIDFDTWDEELRTKPIHKLAARGKTEMIRCILDNCEVDANYVNTTVSYVNEKVQRDKTELIRSVLNDDYSDTNDMDSLLQEAEYVPLYYAVVGDQVETMNFLLQRGGLYILVPLHLYEEYREYVEYREGLGKLLNGLLFLALRNGSLRVALELMQVPCTMEDSPQELDSSLRILKQHCENVALVSPTRKPLHAACQKGKEDVFKAMSDFLEDTLMFQDELLFYIARGGSKEMIDILESQFNQIDCLTETFTKQQVLELLLAEDGSASLLDDLHFNSDGFVTFFNIAIASGNTEIVQYVRNLQQEVSKSTLSSSNDGSRESMALASSETSSSSSTSSAADQYGDYNRLLSHLEEEIITIHHALDNHEELARKCCEKGHLEILKFLEHCGLDLDSIRVEQERPDFHHNSLLHLAAYYGHTDMTMYLLERGFLVDNPFHFMGQTPLQVSCSREYRSKEVVSHLLKMGADPNYVDHGGYTAMDIAAGRRDREIVQLLVDYGFDLGKKNRWGEDYMTMVANI